MLKSKQELEKEVADLRRELNSQMAAYSQLKEQADLVSEAGLPPCKGPYCFNCAHAVFSRGRAWGQWVLLGCGKDAPCGGYVPVRGMDGRTAQCLRSDLERQEKLSVNMEPKTGQHFCDNPLYKPGL